MEMHYKQYQNIKRQLNDLQYCGYQLGSILAIWIINIVEKKDTFWQNPKHLLKVFVEPNLQFLAQCLNSEQSIIIYTDHKRKDYEQMMQAIACRLKIRKKCKVNSLQFAFKLFNILKACNIIFYIDSSSSILTKINILLHLVPVLNAIDFLEKNGGKINIKYAIIFNSAFEHENLISQFLCKKNIPRFSMQHGVYYQFKKYISMDVINYENICADYVMLWGEYAYNELLEWGISSKILIITGHPTKKTAITKIYPCSNKGLILLARKTFDRSNKKLLHILATVANSLNLELQIRLHPSLDEKIYNKLAQKTGFVINIEKNSFAELQAKNNYGFAISYNTTAYYDLLHLGLIAFRYIDELADITLGLDDTFSSPNEFMAKFKIAQNCDNVDLLLAINEVLRSVVGINIDRYKEAIETLTERTV